MHVKICGLTNVDDALAAIDAGADYLGFNFYPKSPRCISMDSCARIAAQLVMHHASGVTLVGIFVNEPPARVAAILDGCGLDLAQLHGEELPEHLTVLWGRAFKAFRGMADGADYSAFAKISPGAPALLVDAHAPNAYGGTGQVADWAAARALAAQFPIFLAGGLTPENVADAIAQVDPWGVDVASGVESAPGRKDHIKVRAFVKVARSIPGTQGTIGTEGTLLRDDRVPAVP
jgi:phosphoribosylanthranilate isomerase